MAELAASTAVRLQQALEGLRGAANTEHLANLEPRYGITAQNALGTPMAAIKKIAKSFGRDQPLAEALWETNIYEARLLTSLLADPALVSRALADRWRADFDNWAVCDSFCFNLFDRLPFAFELVDAWSGLNAEYGRRAAFALLACLALHRHGSAADYLSRLALIEAAATDSRNFVKKSVSWALRAIGGKKDPLLRSEARVLAARLAISSDASSRWIGKDALRAFKKADAGKAAEMSENARGK